MSAFDYSGPSRVLTPAMRRKKPGPKAVILACNYGHHFCPPITGSAQGQAERDRSAAIEGKRNDRRSQ